MKLNRLELIISVSLILVIAVGGFLSGNVMMAMGTAKEDPSQAIESPTPLIGQEPEEMLEVQPEETAFQAVPTVAPGCDVIAMSLLIRTYPVCVPTRGV